MALPPGALICVASSLVRPLRTRCATSTRLQGKAQALYHQEMTYALCTVVLEQAQPVLEDAAARLDVAVESVDPDFGLVPIDPTTHTYAVRVDEQAIGWRAEKSRFSDPKIEPFGP